MTDTSEAKPSVATAMNILVVDDEQNIRRTLTICLESEGHHVVAVSNPADALAEASRRSFDMAFVDLRLGAQSGIDLIPQLRGQSPWIKIAVITAYASIDSAVESMKLGARDYLPKPFTPAQVKVLTRHMGELRMLEQRVMTLQEALGKNSVEQDIALTQSPSMQRIVHLAQQVAATDATVLIRGESGTGKGVLVRAIHAWSQRAQRPLGTVSCPSLSAELLESELFGHVKGAFTGALRDNAGRIAMCDNGTLFLDEIGDLPLQIQPKLLRFIQDREYERLGESITRRADLRVITATNVDLDKAVKDGRFREDLLYRLNVIQLEIPPLRERVDDIVPLAERLLTFFSKQNNRVLLGFTPEAQALMRAHRWPGNVRELRNVVERCAILCMSEYVGVEHLPPTMTQVQVDATPGTLVSLDKIEEFHIRRVLAATRSLEEAAAILGIDTATLWRRRKKYGI